MCVRRQLETTDAGGGESVSVVDSKQLLPLKEVHVFIIDFIQLASKGESVFIIDMISFVPVQVEVCSLSI